MRDARLPALISTPFPVKFSRPPTTMLGLKKSDDFQPVGWVGHFPIHVATLLVGLHVTTMVITTIALALQQYGLLHHLQFSSSAVFDHFAIWQFGTYAFVNSPSIWFAVEMFLLFSFGRETEKFIGRSAFIALYAMLLGLTPCLLMAIGWFVPITFAGSGSLHFAVFIAFATLYPNVDLLFSIKAKWVALILLAISSLQALASHGWSELLVLLASAGMAWFFIERLRRGLEFSPIGFIRRKLLARKIAASPLRVVKRPPPEREDAMATIDPILDKIATQGIGSLSAREREQLESARKALLKKKV